MNFTYLPQAYNTKSANEVVPIVINLLNPKSVVDVGCGIGTWLSVFKDKGINDILGIDGEHVNKEILSKHIDTDEFVSHDLTKPLKLSRKFDLVISLEVAEHLPEEFADVFIESLISLGDCILFSAAVPFQHGDGHINLKWPSYWQDKFKKHNFEFYDCLRESIWFNEEVEWWYRQNIFLVARKNIFLEASAANKVLDLIHPKHYEIKSKQLEEALEDLQKFWRGNIPLSSFIKLFLKFTAHKLSHLMPKLKKDKKSKSQT